MKMDEKRQKKEFYPCNYFDKIIKKGLIWNGGTWLEEFLKKEYIFDKVSVSSGTKKEALKIISHFCARISGLKEEKLLGAFWRREWMESTGCGEGVAIPHATVDGIKEVVVTFFRLESPVNWDSIDTRPVDIIFALIIPHGRNEESYLSLLALLARKLVYEEFVSSLRKCRDREELYTFIEKEIRR